MRTFQHVISRLSEKHKVALTKETNPDKYRSTMKLRGTNAYSWIKEPNELWMIDASPVDALCVDGRWTLDALCGGGRCNAAAHHHLVTHPARIGCLPDAAQGDDGMGRAGTDQDGQWQRLRGG